MEGSASAGPLAVLFAAGAVVALFAAAWYKWKKFSARRAEDGEDEIIPRK